MNTPIELRLQDALKAVGIGFRTHKRLVGRYVVDIVLDQAPIVIEADGVIHQVHGSEYDAKRNKAHEAAGYRTFRFTGSEINSDAGACIQRVIEECDLTPDYEPVFDIKTRLAGPDHPRWNGGPEDALCEQCGSSFQRRRTGRTIRFCSPQCYGKWARKTGVLRGKPRTEKQLAAQAIQGKRWEGRTHTPEARAKISASRMGQTSWNKGVSPSNETRAKISASLTGYRDPDEIRAKKSESHKGKKLSEAHKAAIRAGHARRKQAKIESDLARERENGAEMTSSAVDNCE